METNDTLIELDLPPGGKRERILKIIAVYFSLILIFILSSSYKNPTIRSNNKLIPSGSSQMQELLNIYIENLGNEQLKDTTCDINSQINTLVIDFYISRGYQPAWTSNFQSNLQFASLLNLLDSAAYFGFPYDYFNTAKLQQLSFQIDNKKAGNTLLIQQLKLEVEASYAAFKFMIFLKHGIIQNDLQPFDHMAVDHFSDLLNSAANKTVVREEMLSVQPDLLQHRNLIKSLSYFIDLHYSVKYTTPKFIGDKLLAKSLYYAGVNDFPLFDSIHTKAEALKKLAPEYNSGKNSILNPPTHEKLVSLLEYRYYQASLNLNRLRKLNHSGDNYLFVNIPEYKLQVVESNQIKEVFNVIVGTTSTPTPTFTSNIEKVIANPYWTVPRSIVLNEMLRKIRTDSTYLKRNGYFIINNQEEMVDESIIDWNADDPLGNKYWIRQTNNHYNALGKVKFIFPNEYSVYLHDTQAKTLFSRNKRTFSHGCIRIENPDRLAQYITDKYHLENENITGIISGDERHEIELSEKLKIHIQYITCSVDNGSEIVFYEDVYNRDEQEIRTIFPRLATI